MSLAPNQPKKPQISSLDRYFLHSLVLAGMFVTVAFLMQMFPIFFELFGGSRVVLPLVGMIFGLIGTFVIAFLLLRKRKYQVGITLGIVLTTIFVMMYIAWIRFNVYASYGGGADALSPIDVLSARPFYTQQEYGAGVGLALAFVLLGLLVSCIPAYRAPDIPENIEKAKIERAQELRKKQGQFRVRALR